MDGPLGGAVDREGGPDFRPTPPFSLLSPTFAPVTGFGPGVCALKGNVTEGKRAQFGLSRIKSQLCHSRATWTLRQLLNLSLPCFALL